MKNISNSDYLLRIEEVLEKIPVSRASWYRGIKRGDFPVPVKVGRSSFWRYSDIQDIILRNPENQPMPASSVYVR